MTLTIVDIVILERPSWSSKTTWFARLYDRRTDTYEDCPHSHSRRDLAHRCAQKMCARFIINNTNNNEGEQQ